jgi:uncharacterized caspase-like protein
MMPNIAAKPKKHAILIGADEYARVSKLNYCGKDARELDRTFRETLQFERTLLFTTESKLKPQRNEIIHNLGEFLKGAINPVDHLLFFFSGHGMINRGDKKDYLLPIDASPNELSLTGLAVDWIADKLVESGCKNIVLFIDACREEVSGAKGVQSVGAYSTEAVERKGIVTFFSCDPKEKSYEIAELEHGSFTYCVLQAIEQTECETVEAVNKYLTANVPLINAKYQKPAQLPFTVIKPADKGQLQIFYSERRSKVTGISPESLDERLGRFFNEAVLDQKCFNEVFEFLERCENSELNGADQKRMSYIKGLCSGELKPRAFKAAWTTLERYGEKPAKKEFGKIQ